MPCYKFTDSEMASHDTIVAERTNVNSMLMLQDAMVPLCCWHCVDQAVFATIAGMVFGKHINDGKQSYTPHESLKDDLKDVLVYQNENVVSLTRTLSKKMGGIVVVGEKGTGETRNRVTFWVMKSDLDKIDQDRFAAVAAKLFDRHTVDTAHKVLGFKKKKDPQASAKLEAWVSVADPSYKRQPAVVGATYKRRGQ